MRRVVSERSSDAIPATPLIPMRQRSCKVEPIPDHGKAGRAAVPGFAYSDAMREKGAARGSSGTPPPSSPALQIVAVVVDGTPETQKWECITPSGDALFREYLLGR
jgi:hypothetical protein